MLRLSLSLSLSLVFQRFYRLFFPCFPPSVFSFSAAAFFQKDKTARPDIRNKLPHIFLKRLNYHLFFLLVLSTLLVRPEIIYFGLIVGDWSL